MHWKHNRHNIKLRHFKYTASMHTAKDLFYAQVFKVSIAGF